MIAVVFAFLLLCFLYVMINHSLHGFLFFILLTIQISSVIIFKLKKDKKLLKHSHSDLRSILEILSKIFLIVIFIIIVVINFKIDKVDAQIVKFFCYESVYICFAILYFIVMNYCVTESLKIKHDLKCLIYGIDSFFRKNFLMNILMLIILFIIKLSSKNQDGLFLGILGSYVFYMITEINIVYKKMKKNVEMSEVIFQLMLNIVLISLFSDFEYLLNAAYMGTAIKMSFFHNLYIHLTLVIVALWIAKHLDMIKKFLLN